MRNAGVPMRVGAMGWSRRMLAPSRRLVTNTSPAVPPLSCVHHEHQVTPHERRAAGSALRSFLRHTKGFKLSEASAVQRASPIFASKLALLAKDNAAALSSDGNDIKSCSTFLLQEHRIDVAEAVLESLGGGHLWTEETLPKLDTSDQSIRNILDVVEVLHGLGFLRKRMWRLFQANSYLWSSSPAEVESSIVQLKSLGMGRELTKVVTSCPLLIGRGSDEVRNGIVSTLRELEVDQKHAFNLLSLFQKAGRDSLQPVTEILEEHGVAGEQVRELLSLNALRLVAEVNPTIGSVIDWFSRYGVDEKVSWKAVILNPVVFCRSTNALEEQLSILTEYGLSQAEVFELMTKHSLFLVWNRETLEPKLEYLTKSMGYPAQILLGCPRYLKSSLECRVKPRHELIEWLEKESKTRRPATLSYLFLSEDAFLSAYEKLHSDALEFYRNKQAEYSNPCEEKTPEGSDGFHESAEAERHAEHELSRKDIGPVPLCSTEDDEQVSGAGGVVVSSKAPPDEEQETEACLLHFENSSTDVAETPEALKDLSPPETGRTPLPEAQEMVGEEAAAAVSHADLTSRPANSFQQELFTSVEVHVSSSSEQVGGGDDAEYEELTNSFDRSSTSMPSATIAAAEPSLQSSYEDSTDVSNRPATVEASRPSQVTSAGGTSTASADTASRPACERSSATPSSEVNKRSNGPELGILGFFRKFFAGFSN